jgi:hypothetical protein
MDNRNIIRTIENESPDTHWGFLPVTNKVVLDLGCGLNSEFMPTPCFFIQERGASKVIGVDPNQQSYQWYKQNYNVHNFICHMDYADTIFKLEWYMKHSGANIAKIDIEGSEILMNAINPEILSGFSNIAIEYHNLPSLIAVERLLKENGFTIEFYKFPNLPIDHQGVIHGYKPTNLFVELEKIN